MINKADLLPLEWTEAQGFVFPEWSSEACNWYELSDNPFHIKWQAYRRRVRLHDKLSADPRFTGRPCNRPTYKICEDDCMVACMEHPNCRCVA